MKRTFAIIIAGLLLLGLVGCAAGSSQQSEATASPAAVTEAPAAAQARVAPPV